MTSPPFGIFSRHLTELNLFLRHKNAKHYATKQWTTTCDKQHKQMLFPLNDYHFPTSPSYTMDDQINNTILFNGSENKANAVLYTL